MSNYILQKGGKRELMKILIINPILYTSETDKISKVNSIKDTMIYAMCKGFIKNGDVPVLVAADAYKPTIDEEYPFSILWFSCALPQIFKPRCLPYLKGLGKYLKQHQDEYDYIISGEVFSLLTLCAAIYTKRKLVIWHELGAHNNLMRKIPSKFWYNIVARLFMQGIPVIPRSQRASTFIRRFSNKVLPICIDHGVDLDKICYNRQKEDCFVVLSQLIERKHIDGIIDSFSAFRKGKFENYQLKIIGDGVLREKLQERVRNLGEDSYIDFLGKLDHETLMPILAKSKALLINTSKDNSMVSIVESIAAGTPIITTPVPFNATYIRDNSLGIVKENWNQKELEEICENNSFYVENCISYREKLSNEYLAKLFNQVGGSLG